MSVETDIEKPYERLVGETLANRYQIETRLGEGAMGAVYRAKHIKVGRSFAVKVLHPRLLEDKKTLQRFEREAELAGRLRHPNVIGVVDVGETHDGMRYMVMDFAEGPDLASLLSDAPFPPQRIIELTRQLLEGLFHAHEQGLIHRDFKPENVIVERDSHGNEVPRIVDFGIAILREGGQSSTAPGRLTTNGLVLGTPHYMAPEQAVADPIDHRIDLFALGIMVYEMICGKLPFDGSGAEVARANLLLDPPPIAQRVPYLEADPLLEAFARRLMAKKRDLRPATAKVARDLLDLIERDREAAAASLGVPLNVAQRPPMSTQPVEPLRHGNGEGTFPPPLRSPIETPPQAPALSAAKAVRSSERHVSTQTSEPLPRKRRTPMIIASVVGATVVAGAVVVMMNGNQGTAKAEDNIAAPGEPTKVEPPVAETQPPTPSPSEAPLEATQPTEANVEPAADADAAANVVTPAEIDPAANGVTPPEIDPAANVNPTAAKSDVRAKTAPTGVNAKRGTSKSTKLAVTKVDTKRTKPVETKPVETKPVETRPVETKPVEVKPEPAVDAKRVAHLYKTVGAQLGALQQSKGADAASDLWSRYRLIRIADAMSTPDKQKAAAALLSKLSSDIAARNR